MIGHHDMKPIVAMPPCILPVPSQPQSGAKGHSAGLVPLGGRLLDDEPDLLHIIKEEVVVVLSCTT